MAKDLLLEVGLEEVPAKFMPPALSQLAELAEKTLQEKRIAFSNVSTYGTPRRLVLFIQGLVEQQEDLEKEVRGPAKKAAFDADGNPTKAVLGFAKSQGVEVGDLEIRDTGNGEYVYALVQEKGQPTSDILPDLLPQIITGLNFPKNMRWGDKDLRFARPIKWLLALYGEELVSFELAEVYSGKVTYGHRFLSKGPLEVVNPEDYFAKMSANFVVVKEKEREAIIAEQVKKIAQEQGGEALFEEGLLNEVNFLVEYPTALYGKFNEDYLALPSEVLVTTMREHQRYFPVVDENNKLLPVFITVRNGTADHIEIVRDGNERVLKARLADAKFFFDEDRKTPLADQVEKLKNIVFQEGMGSIYDKVERLMKMAEIMTKMLEMDPGVGEKAKSVAYLSKADLVANMVKEFTELQGIMGREYALSSGASAETAQGIFEHYLPRFAGDILPQSTIGKIVSIADKMDTLVACFSLGLIPTGSQDPYALRRQSYGIVNILLEAEWKISLGELVEQALNLLPEANLKRSKEEIKNDVLEFFRQRIKNLLLDKGIRYDVVDAVMEVGYKNVANLWLRAQAVKEFTDRPEFENLLAGFTRVDNLARKAESGGARPELFAEEAEKDLYTAYLVVKNEVGKALLEEKYQQAMLWLAKIRMRVDAFLEQTMVMVEDLAVRDNRLALLKDIQSLFLAVANFNQIVKE